MSIETSQKAPQRLQFGIPLDEAFLTKFAVHPTLLNVFEETYDRVAKSGQTVTTVLRCQGTLEERLALKERIISCEILTNVKSPPGTFLWIIRHYLGLLPVQILPKYIGTAKFVWYKIGKQCERYLRSPYFSWCNSTEVIDRVIKELKRLPLQNFLLLMSFLSFLRMLVVLPRGEPVINKKSLSALAKFYAPSMFVRPFHPGSRNRYEYHYFSLLLYIILKWNDIHTIVMGIKSCAFDFTLSKLQFGETSKKDCKFDVNVTATLRSHCATQTLPNSILRIIPEWYEACDFVRDSFCQTDDDPDETSQISPKSNKQTYCCCLSKRRHRNNVTRSSAYDSESSKEFSDSPEYLYDEYSRCNLVGDYENVKDFDPYAKDVSQVTRPEELANPYRLSDDIRESINRELKEKFCLMHHLERSESVNDEAHSSAAPYESKHPARGENFTENFPSEVANGTKSLMNVKKIRSKLEFLRVFKSNSKSGKICTFDSVKSEIKYQKM